MEHWFDNLSRASAANRLSRRQVMAGLGGAMGAALLPLTGEAWATHVDCRAFCHQFPPGSSRTRCVRQGREHRGPCFNCGPGAGPSSGTEFCVDRCCHEGEHCVDGECVSDGGNQPCETFVCGFPACASRPIPSPSDCFCFEVVGGTGGICLGNFFCLQATPCPNGQADCAAGETCVTNTCCGPGVQLCAPACPPADAAVQISLLSEVGGPTAGSR